jgi:hypothetical protein
MYSHVSPATSVRLPLPIQAGCKFVGSRWSASFWSHQLRSPTCVPIAVVKIQETREPRKANYARYLLRPKRLILFERGLYSSAEWVLGSEDPYRQRFH